MDVTLRIVGQADTKQVEAVKAKLEELKPAVEKALAAAAPAAAAASAAFNKAGEATIRANEAMAKAAIAAKAAQEAIAKYGADSDKAALAVARSQTAALNAAKALETAKKAADEAADGTAKAAAATDELGTKGATGIARLTAALGPVGTAAAAAAAAIVGIGTAAIGAAAVAVKMGAETSAAYATLANETGATGAALDGLESSLRRVSATVAAGMGDVSLVMGQLSTRTGLTGSALEAMTKQQLQLAKVTGTDVNQNIMLTTRMFGDWGIATDQQAGKLDLLFRASQQTGVGVDELSRLVVQFGAPLRNFGFSIEEGVTMLGKWQQAGVNTELVMGSLRIASGKFADAGIDLREGLKGAIEAIKEAKSSSEATAIAMDVFGARAGADMADTIRGGKFEIEQWVAAVKNGESTIKGAAAEAAGLKGAFAALGGAASVALSPITDLAFDLATKLVGSVVPAVGELSAAIGDRLAPIADSARSALMPLVEMIGPILTAAMQELTGGLGAVTEGIGLFFDNLQGSSAIETVRGYIMSLGAALFLLIDAGKAVGSWLVEHAPSWDTLKTALTVVGGAIVGLGAVLLATLAPALVAAATAAVAFIAPMVAAAAPAIALGAVIGLVAGLIITHWDEIKAATTELFASLSQTWQEIQDAISQAVTALWAFVQSAWASGVAWVTAATAAFQAWLSQAWETIKTNVSAAASALWGWLRGAFSAGASFLVGVKTRLAQGFVAVWNWITTTVSSIVARLINWIRTAWQNGMEWVAGLLGRVSSVFSGAWTWIANTVGGLVSRMVNALSAALLAGGKFVASVQDRISDVFQRGWTFVVGIFKSAAGSIIGGIKSLFGGIARIVLDGMTAAGSIVDSILKKIIGRISSFVSSLGLGSVMSGVIGNLKSAAGSILGGLADGFGSIISGIGSGIGNVTSFFSDKIATARGKVSDLFSGFQALKLQSAKEGGAGGGPDTGLGGGGADISALGATAASGPKDIMNVGDAGRDSQGDYYIDENGAKVYTSGAGLAKQQAKERAREAREAERAARADKSASRASARREASEGSVAREMADTAKKVAEAVQAGLDAIEGLRGSEIPGEAIWRPRLDALSAFVAAAAEKFQAIGKGLLTQIGVTDEGTAKLDDAAAQQAQAASDLGGSMMDTVTKTATFLQGLVKAKWPTPEQVDLALSQISGVLTRVQAQAQDMASKIAMKTEDTDPAAHLGAVGQAVGSWVDAYLKIGAEAEKLAKMPPVPEGALASVENIMRRVSGMMGSLLVGPGYDLLEDTEASKDHLSVADAMAGTIQAGLDVVMRAAETARELQRVPPVDEGALDAVQTIMQRVSAMIGALVVGPGYDLLADNERSTRDLATAREMVATIAAGTDLVDKIAAGARTLARVRDVPDTALDAIQAVMRRVSDMIGALVVGPGYNLFADNEKSLADLSVARAMVDTIGAGVALVEQTGRLGDVLARAKPIPQAAVEAIYATWRRVSDILGGLLIGPGYNLLADPERTIRDLSVARALVDLLSVAVGMVTQTAVMGDALARANPIPPGAVDVAVQTAVQVERLVREAASAWRAAIEAAGGWIEDTMAMTRNYADHLKSVLGVATEAAKLKLDKVLPLDPAALEVALANAALVERRVRAYADQWATIMETAGLWTDEVAAGVKLYTEHAKNTIGLVQAAAGLSLKDILPLDPAMLDVALENARLAERRVRAFADAWASALEAADLVLADVAARVKTYADHIKEVVGIVDAAGGLGIEDVVPIDEFQVTLALSNVRLAEGWVRRWAGEWHRMMTAAGVEIEAVLAETKTYSEQVKAVVDTIMAGAELVLTDVKALSVADIERVLANVTLVLDRVSAYAGEWADAIRAGGRKLEDVVADAEGYHTVVGGAVEMIVKASDAFRHLVANPPPRIMPGVMALLREQITMMILDLAGIYDVVEDEKGRLKKAGDVAAIVAPAADAVAKALDALSIERLLKNPLTDTKLRSGFMQRVADRRFEALAKQISAGVRRAVQALVDGLTGITIPEGIATALDPLVAVYERVVALIERINALAVPDAAKLAQIIGLAQGLGALGGTGAPPPASGHGFTGGAQGKGTPLVPPPGGGGAGGAGGGGARMDATINVTSPVYLDTEQIGAAIERTLMARNLAIVVTPQGG